MFFPQVAPMALFEAPKLNAMARPHGRQPLYRKCMWTAQEDNLLRQAVEQFGKNWSMIATMVPGRNGKQCRERWSGMLNPELAKDAWTPEEDRLLIKLHNEYGNKWAKISEFLPGRSRISLRNRWGWHVRHCFRVPNKRAKTEAAPVEASAPSIEVEPNAGVKIDGEELDSWTNDIEKDLWMEMSQMWFA